MKPTLSRHDRVHPVVTVADGDLDSVADFYRRMGWQEVTLPDWAAAGAVTLAWDDCPVTLVAVSSGLGAAEPTVGLVVIMRTDDLSPITAAIEAAGVTPSSGASKWGRYIEVTDPAGTRVHFLSRAILSNR